MPSDIKFRLNSGTYSTLFTRNLTHPSSVHCRWSVENTTESTCNIDVKIGVHFKKWCPMQSKIKSGAITEYKKEVELMLEVARSCINPSIVGDDTTSVAPVSTTEGNA
nr:BAG-associated GRAM protein 1-like [Tanacetum cinerariifolium]